MHTVNLAIAYPLILTAISFVNETCVPTS